GPGHQVRGPEDVVVEQRGLRLDDRRRGQHAAQDAVRGVRRPLEIGLRRSGLTTFAPAGRKKGMITLLLAGVLFAQDALEVGGRKVAVRKPDALPVVESDYTKRFKFDSADNPKLRELREKYKLDDVVAPGKDEFDKQVLLLDWTHQQFKKFGRPSANPRGALEILKCV